jgi:hypothetical protein
MEERKIKLKRDQKYSVSWIGLQPDIYATTTEVIWIITCRTSEINKISIQNYIFGTKNYKILMNTQNLT